MKKTLLFIAVAMLLSSTGIFAQKVNTDSLNLVSKISADQLKLGKLQNEVEEKTKDKNDAAEKAQKSANENAEAATKLSNNPDDKKLARQADRKAGDARSDAKAARKAATRLDDLNKDIADLKDKIADEQSKLNKMLAPVAAAPTKTDSTQH